MSYPRTFLVHGSLMKMLHVYIQCKGMCCTVKNLAINDVDALFSSAIQNISLFDST